MIDLNDIIRRNLPQWNVAEFVFLEPTLQWAPAVQAELLSGRPRHPKTTPVHRTDPGADTARYTHRSPHTASTTDFRCISVRKDREVLERIQGATPAGVILFAADRYRECLLLLGRLGRLCRAVPAVLVVVPSAAETMMPLLLESGATTVYAGRVTDIRIATWCRRVASQTSETTAH